jgi:integrase
MTSSKHVYPRVDKAIDDLRFHDLRREATSRLFERGLSVMEVASITGHRVLEMLRRYTVLDAQNIATKLGE